MRLVVMGVAGSGKTTISLQLAEHLDARLVEADDAHPQANIDKMSAGEPLTDEDRWPWLDALKHELETTDRIVVTCSALKRSYRDVLRAAGEVRFVYLRLSPDEAVQRLRSRTSHFMGPDMVASQFAALEEPDPVSEPDVLTLDATKPPTELAQVALGQEGPHEPPT